jgi:hypothetical protein
MRQAIKATRAISGPPKKRSMNEVSITGILKRFRNEKLFPVWAIFLLEVCDIPESNLGIPATRRALAAVSQAGMRNTARDDEGARVLISPLLRPLDLSRWAFPPHMDCGSLLPLSGGQPAGRRRGQDDISSRRSRVGGSREVSSVTGRLWRQQGCLGKALSRLRHA